MLITGKELKRHIKNHMNSLGYKTEDIFIKDHQAVLAAKGNTIYIFVPFKSVKAIPSIQWIEAKEWSKNGIFYIPLATDEGFRRSLEVTLSTLPRDFKISHLHNERIF